MAVSLEELKKMGSARVLMAASLVCLVAAGTVACDSSAKGNNIHQKVNTKSGANAKRKNIASVQPNGIDKLSAAEITNRANQTMEEIHSVRTVLKNSIVGFNLAADTEGNCKGSSQTGTGTLDIIKRGDDVYMKGDSAFWKAELDDYRAAAVEQKARDHYIKTSTSDAVFTAETAGMCDPPKGLSGVLHNFAIWEGKDENKSNKWVFTKQGVTKVDGVSAVELQSTDNGMKASVFVSLVGQPYLLKVRSQGVDMNFKDHNKSVSVEPPTKDETIEASEIPELVDVKSPW
ncbi:hypothetical protein [Streptomyces flaveolus]|uniref:hypothetical protein n=1 Tax=Streptomyces flaveolus TaxID=67297 RepID=UPI00340F3373